MSREYLEKRLREIAAERAAKRRSSTSPQTRSSADRNTAPKASTAANDMPRETETRIPKMHVWGHFVYECRAGVFDKGLNPEKARCGALLDRLLGVIAAKPPYLHLLDALRYAALIQRFRGFVGFQGSVPDLPLQRLRIALSGWVNDALKSEETSLMPSFALDAARFIEAHAYGGDFHVHGGDRWEIKPLVEDSEETGSEGLNGNRQLKRDITSRLKGLLVRAEVPAGARIVNSRTKETAGGPGPIFVEVDRCHLSSGLGPDITHLEIAEDTPMRHDVAQEFSFFGCLWPAAAVSELISDGGLKHTYRLQNLHIPGRWINAALQPLQKDKYPLSLHWVAIPTWN